VLIRAFWVLEDDERNELSAPLPLGRRNIVSSVSSLHTTRLNPIAGTSPGTPESKALVLSPARTGKVEGLRRDELGVLFGHVGDPGRGIVISSSGI
jgi:hypothetical protein